MHSASHSAPHNPLGSLLGSLLRDLRASRRLTQAQAARAGGLGRVTLARWESGAQRPRVPELNALLDALGANPILRSQALALLGTPHALAAVQAEGDRAGFGPAPGGADLLRAMRRRRSLPLDAAAAALGVRPWTLRRWETGEAWPDPSRLQALCTVLGAHPAEAAALMAGPVLFGPALSAPVSSGWNTPAAESLPERLTALHRRIQAGGSALTTLECLSLEAQAWPLALLSDEVHSEEGRYLLFRGYFLHAMYANFCRDVVESARQARRAIEVWPDRCPKEPAWFYCSVLAAQGLAARGTPRGRRQEYRRLLSLQDHLAAGDRPARWASPEAVSWGEMAAWIPAQAANCLAKLGEWEEALSLGWLACRIASERSDLAEQRHQLCELSFLLLAAGRPAEAFDVLEGLGGENRRDMVYTQVDIALARVQAFLGMGRVGSAQDWLGEASRLIQRYDLPGYRTDVAALALYF